MESTYNFSVVFWPNGFSDNKVMTLFALTYIHNIIKMAVDVQLIDFNAPEC